MSDRATKPSPEVYLMQQQVEKMKNELKEERAIFDHHRNQQERRLQEEVSSRIQHLISLLISKKRHSRKV